MLKRQRWQVLVVGMMFLTLLVACETGGQGGTKPTIKIGSKGFTEQLILGEMMAVLLEQGGYTVERNLNLSNSDIAHQALTSGEIDMYPEYTILVRH